MSFFCVLSINKNKVNVTVIYLTPYGKHVLETIQGESISWVLSDFHSF
jgi:hypothetical protein